MKNERKEELKDEMKNRISLALKDPILQQGFEIICKENAELARKLEQTEKDLADYQFNYPTIKELQKENAELKTDLNEKENTVHTLDVLHKEAVRKYGEVNDQLTKAKEIIKNLMVFAEMDDRDYEKEYKEAEQFLNSEVEK